MAGVGGDPAADEDEEDLGSWGGLAEGCHLGIRNGTGDYTQHLTLEDRNDILTDYWLPGPFLETGNYTFEVVANLGGGKGCLFALTLTQWLEGRPGW